MIYGDEVTMIKQVDAGVVDICTYNHLDLCLSNSFVFTGLFALFVFICQHLLQQITHVCTIFSQLLQLIIFFELLLYHITALTVLFSFFCFFSLQIVLSDDFLLQMVIQAHCSNPPLCLSICCFAIHLAISLLFAKYFIRLTL